MRIIRNITEMQAAARAERAEGKRIGLVPTMGYLHEGHLSLMRLARKQADVLVVSHFVNPAQFGPDEDFSRYPRDFDRDRELCRQESADIIFHPSCEEMYPEGHTMYVTDDALSEVLEGAHRPGHFRGVLTVVAKLFNAVLPDFAVFGRKDVQQLILIRRMARDLNFPVEIVSGPTVRETDDLAMSSRNAYLSESERLEALSLSRALREAERLYEGGERDGGKIRAALHDILNRAEGARVDYAEIVDVHTLRPCDRLTGPALAVLAVHIGNTRLIDNIVLAEGDFSL